MFVFFGKDKCPICGKKGKKVDNSFLHCMECDIHFNEFGISKKDCETLQIDQDWYISQDLN
jgi:uncharacterized membrane protein